MTTAVLQDRRATRQRKEAAARLHRDYRQSRDEQVRMELIRQYQALAQSMVSRFCRRVEEREDLEQVVQIALVRALDRFEPERDVEFSTFAWATVRGEIKRYYRDHSWRLRVPRRLQEHYLVVSAAVDELSHELSRSPTLPEIADATGLSLEEVVEAIEVRRAYRVASLDAPVREDGEEQLPVGGLDPGMTAAEDRTVVESLVRRLPEREQRIVMLRFVHEMTQSEIAEKVKLSQMQVSRLLAKSLDQLRTWATEA
ncbi:MAG TPA: sigma-70 family RNA polymerase sigma factor [Acidimicrobiales bacterium]|nr:sigma-70 family RNA polymerase sigma factor [Acidimicrobiales bacterium]